MYRARPRSSTDIALSLLSAWGDTLNMAGSRRRLNHIRGRWTHHVIIEKETDLDEDVKGWLHEAYVFSQSRKSKSRN